MTYAEYMAQPVGVIVGPAAPQPEDREGEHWYWVDPAALDPGYSWAPYRRGPTPTPAPPKPPAVTFASIKAVMPWTLPTEVPGLSLADEELVRGILLAELRSWVPPRHPRWHGYSANEARAHGAMHPRLSGRKGTE